MLEERKIRAFGSYFTNFINTLSEEESKKIFYVLDMLKMHARLNQKFVKHIQDGIYELRSEYNGNIFRVFFLFDEGNLILLLNGFKKKSRKAPKKELETAYRLRNKYYDEKRK